MIFRMERSHADKQPDFAGLLEAIEAYLDAQSVPQATKMQMMVALDEAVSNSLHYGGASGSNHASDPESALPTQALHAPNINVQINVGNDRVAAEISDDGTAFDPLTSPEPDTTLSIEDRQLGGLGIHIIRKIMDEISYRRKDGWNTLRFSKTFPLE